MITGKRSVSSMYYRYACTIFALMAWVGKLLSECTWEKQSTLPAKLVDDYEKGAVFDVMDSMSESVGQTVHTPLCCLSHLKHLQLHPLAKRKLKKPFKFQKVTQGK